MGSKPLPDFRAARVAAGDVLSRKSNRLKLIEGIVLCFMPVLLTVLLAQVFGSVLAFVAADDVARPIAAIVFNCVSALLQLFFTLPLVVGLLGMAARMVEGEYVSLVDLFEPFSSGKSYRKTLAIAFRWFWTFGLLTVAVRLTIGLFRVLGRVHILIAIPVAFLCVAEVILWIVFVWLRRFVTISFFFSGRMPLRKARRAARNMAGQSQKGGVVWLLCFLPWIILGLLTVGILLLADVLPRMCVSYYLYCDQLTKNANLPEESEHE